MASRLMLLIERIHTREVTSLILLATAVAVLLGAVGYPIASFLSGRLL